MFAGNPSPFRFPKHQEDLITPYERTVGALARRFIYDTGDLKPLEVEREMNRAISNPDTASIENDRGELEALKQLLQGIAEHEVVNIDLKAWQAELSLEDHPELLSREAVSEKFKNFNLKKPLEFAEKRAVQHYQSFLRLGSKTGIQLTDNIRLEPSDIEVLLIDLHCGITERSLNTEERRAELTKLDAELLNIIEHIPDDQSGKRFELQELYLLRRLIHNADTGHLASVRHGTPREDLRSDMGSVDLAIAAAGDVYNFQVKTFKSGTHQTGRALQAAIHERAERNLKGSSTHLVVLEAESVREAFEKLLRQGKGLRHSLADKFETLEPITSALSIRQRNRLLLLTGLTEEELAQEQISFNERQAEMTAHGEAWREKRRAEDQKAKDMEEQRAAKIQAEEEARLAGPKRHEENIRRAQEEALEKQRRQTEAAKTRQEHLEAEQAAALKEELRLRKEAAMKATKETSKATKGAEKEWAQTKLAQLGKPDALIEQGLLAKEDRNNLASILAAKKLLAAKYPNTKSVLKDFPPE